ncbi:helicase-related protein [Companilactobacillus furfuricola]|uniref:helicase-related protein n=1 Tax=Companilactobacillus furfuricola TaxID=1462575 RepID=UPI000F76E7D6|nr:helicase-related protein [Companilactobacillus furfuricola]
MENINEYLGGRITNTRLLTPQQISQLLHCGAKLYPATFSREGHLYCRRCFSTIDLDDFRKIQPYCRKCINFGKLLVNDQILITDGSLNFPADQIMTWQGQLTDQQSRVCHEVLKSYQNNQDHLIWAVTGAGKTEIIFPLIKQIIDNGQRVAICSPRIDVCIELFPRLQQAFAQTTIGLFHGKNEQQYFPCQIMIATVHQLVRFEKAFDVLIVDEVDSFPLAGDEMLHRAIIKAKKVSGTILYLSATPPMELLKQVKQNQLHLSKLYRRFHGHPLPEPKCHLLLRPSNFLQINPRIKWLIQRAVKASERLMIFFPRIPDMLIFERSLKRLLPQVSILSVSSKDDQRIEKVQRFRNKEAQIILTTTILERGVTFPKIEVLVIDADAPEFSKTALIQIAGRAGRDKGHPDDEVHLYYQFYTEKISAVCREIKSVNQQAGLK